MLETNDLLVKCPRVGAWPMAVCSRKETFAQREISFKCPKCGSEYLLEKKRKSGTYLTCPNNKATASDEPKRRSKKKAAEKENAVQCDYSVKTAEPEPEKSEDVA